MGSAGLSGYHDEARARGPGLVVGRSGASFGTVHYCGVDYWPLNTALFATDFMDNYPRYVYYALKTLDLTKFNSGSAQPSLNRNFIANITVAIPPRAEQVRIASILAALDDKIDRNRRLAALLEETAAAIFKAWFVDFVGVEEFDESAIGRVPRGWRVARFSEAVEINPPVPIRKGTVVPFIEMAALAPWAMRPTTIGERSYSGGAKFEQGDTLMARITGCIEHGKGAFIDFLTGPGAGSTEFLVLRAKYPLTPEAVFLLSRTDRLRSHAIANMTGSSGRQRVAIACFDDLIFAVPPDLESWLDNAEVFRAGLAKSGALWRESRSLADIRDALLPRLISGEMRVPDTADPEEVIGPTAEQLAGAAR
jgi:type I restriction enzyme, S subunit